MQVHPYETELATTWQVTRWHLWWQQQWRKWDIDKYWHLECQWYPLTQIETTGRTKLSHRCGDCNQEFARPGATKLLLVVMFLTFFVLMIFSGITTKSLLGQVRSSCGCGCCCFFTFLVLLIFDHCCDAYDWNHGSNQFDDQPLSHYFSVKVDSKLLLSGEARWTRSNGRCQQKGRGNKYCNFSSNDIGQK